jgi:hypothetical protein
MFKKNVKELSLPEIQSKSTPAKQLEQSPRTLAIALCTIAFVSCTLLTVAPLSRIADPVIQLQTPFGVQLAQIGAWLPNNLGLAANPQASQTSTNHIEFLILIAFSFAIYGLCAHFLQRQAPGIENYKLHRQILHLIWLGTIGVGLIYVFTPAMLSHDILVYAGYSRLMATYHANPYFVPLSVYPHDPFFTPNYWANATAAYGPVWLVICSLWGFVLAPQPLAYLLAFRLFALAIHLLNTWLITTILQVSGQSPRIVSLGTLLYAWNPLVLLESSLGGHNDVFMVTFLLVGILLGIQAEKKDRLTHPSGYLLPLIAFTMAVLVKFTMLPVVALFIIFLVWKTLRHTPSTILPFKKAVLHHWRPAFLTVCIASITGALVVLAMYAPFWLGHSIQSIQTSFTSPPSANFAENSILLAIFKWHEANILPANTWSYALLQVLSSRLTWDIINTVILAALIIIGAIWLWLAPTMHTFILAALMMLSILLIVTPWFFSWYITWLVGLAAACLSIASNRAGRALMAFTLTFSASAFLTYLFKDGSPPFGIWTGLICLTTIGPPLLAFFISFAAWRPEASQKINKLETDS